MKITAARRSVNRQYIFITPNAIEGRNTLDKDVKIIRWVDCAMWFADICLVLTPLARLTDPRQRTLTDYS